MDDSKVILFTPLARIELLEQMNQVQYAAILQLRRELEEMRDKLSHAEQLLRFTPVLLSDTFDK
jgi:hypothetical protein